MLRKLCRKFCPHCSARFYFIFPLFEDVNHVIFSDYLCFYCYCYYSCYFFVLMFICIIFLCIAQNGLKVRQGLIKVIDQSISLLKRMWHANVVTLVATNWFFIFSDRRTLISSNWLTFPPKSKK